MATSDANEYHQLEERQHRWSPIAHERAIAVWCDFARERVETGERSFKSYDGFFLLEPIETRATPTVHVVMPHAR